MGNQPSGGIISPTNKEFKSVVPFPNGESQPKRKKAAGRGNKTAPAPDELIDDKIHEQSGQVDHSDEDIDEPLNFATEPKGYIERMASAKDADLMSDPNHIQGNDQSIPPAEIDFRFTEGYSRRNLMADCEFVCSEIMDHLFVGGSKIATSWEVLEANKITRVINCSSSVVENCFIDKPNMKYLSLNMVDGRQDDISWFLCEVIQFIFSGRLAGEKTLLHCEKGISRSCSFAIAYRMWCSGARWKEAFDFVKQRRKVCAPNTAFTCNLIEIDELLSGDARTSTILFRCATHLPHDPNTAVLKMCRNANSRKFISPATSALDPSGVFLVRPPEGQDESIYIWQGSEAKSSTLKAVQNLAKHMRGVLTRATNILVVKEGKEPGAFFAFVSKDEPFDKSKHTAYDDLFNGSDGSRPQLQPTNSSSSVTSATGTSRGGAGGGGGGAIQPSDSFKIRAITRTTSKKSSSGGFNGPAGATQPIDPQAIASEPSPPFGSMSAPRTTISRMNSLNRPQAESSEPSLLDLATTAASASSQQAKQRNGGSSDSPGSSGKKPKDLKLNLKGKFEEAAGADSQVRADSQVSVDQRIPADCAGTDSGAGAGAGSSRNGSTMVVDTSSTEERAAGTTAAVTAATYSQDAAAAVALSPLFPRDGGNGARGLESPLSPLESSMDSVRGPSPITGPKLRPSPPGVSGNGSSAGPPPSRDPAPVRSRKNSLSLQLNLEGTKTTIEDRSASSTAPSHKNSASLQLTLEGGVKSSAENAAGEMISTSRKNSSSSGKMKAALQLNLGSQLESSSSSMDVETSTESIDDARRKGGKSSGKNGLSLQLNLSGVKPTAAVAAGEEGEESGGDGSKLRRVGSIEQETEAQPVTLLPSRRKDSASGSGKMKAALQLNLGSQLESSSSSMDMETSTESIDDVKKTGGKSSGKNVMSLPLNLIGVVGAEEKGSGADGSKLRRPGAAIEDPVQVLTITSAASSSSSSSSSSSGRKNSSSSGKMKAALQLNLGSQLESSSSSMDVETSTESINDARRKGGKSSGKNGLSLQLNLSGVKPTAAVAAGEEGEESGGDGSKLRRPGASEADASLKSDNANATTSNSGVSKVSVDGSSSERGKSSKAAMLQLNLTGIKEPAQPSSKPCYVEAPAGLAHWNFSDEEDDDGEAVAVTGQGSGEIGAGRDGAPHPHLWRPTSGGAVDKATNGGNNSTNSNLDNAGSGVTAITAPAARALPPIGGTTRDSTAQLLVAVDTAALSSSSYLNSPPPSRKQSKPKVPLLQQPEGVSNPPVLHPSRSSKRLLALSSVPHLQLGEGLGEGLGDSGQVGIGPPPVSSVSATVSASASSASPALLTALDTSRARPPDSRPPSRTASRPGSRTLRSTTPGLDDASPSSCSSSAATSPAINSAGEFPPRQPGSAGPSPVTTKLSLTLAMNASLATGAGGSGLGLGLGLGAIGVAGASPPVSFRSRSVTPVDLTIPKLSKIENCSAEDKLPVDIGLVRGPTPVEELTPVKDKDSDRNSLGHSSARVFSPDMVTAASTGASPGQFGPSGVGPGSGLGPGSGPGFGASPMAPRAPDIVLGALGATHGTNKELLVQGQGQVKPLLFQAIEGPRADAFEWESMGVYDDDDLSEAVMMLLLCPAAPHYIWLGSKFDVSRCSSIRNGGSSSSSSSGGRSSRKPSDEDVRAAVALVEAGDLQDGAFAIVQEAIRDGSNVVVTRSGKEGDGFWAQFNEGY